MHATITVLPWRRTTYHTSIIRGTQQKEVKVSFSKTSHFWQVKELKITLWQAPARNRIGMGHASMRQIQTLFSQDTQHKSSCSVSSPRKEAWSQFWPNKCQPGWQVVPSQSPAVVKATRRKNVRGARSPECSWTESWPNKMKCFSPNTHKLVD